MVGSGANAPPLPAAPAGYAADALFVEVYERLKVMASREVARDNATLNTTALVHELYLKVCVGSALSFTDPAQFFSYAAQAMRHILVDRARMRVRMKRDGGVVPLELSEANSVADTTAEHAIEIDEALKQLERDDPRAAQLVTLHYFAGLPLSRISELLGVTVRTLSRDWTFARAYLLDVLG